MRYEVFGLVVATACLFGVSESPARAQSWSWTGASNGSWLNPSNWSPSGPPASGINTQLTFGSTANASIIVGGGIQLNQLTVNAGSPSYSLGLTGPLDFRTNGSGVLPSIAMNSANPLSVTGSNLTLTNNLAIGGSGAGNVTLQSTVTGPGSLTYSGAGTMFLGNSGNSYSGGTFVSGGTVSLSTVGVLPTAGNLSVTSGGTFSTNGLSNVAGTAIGTVTLTNGTFRVPSGSGDYHLNQLIITGGTVDLAGSTNQTLHFRNAGAGITISGVNTWTGGGTSKIVNDTAGPLIVGFIPGHRLTTTIPFSNAGSNSAFTFSGMTGRLVLQSTANTADLRVTNQYILETSDLSTNLGAGAFGTLGTGNFVVSDFATLEYTGPTATCAKPINIGTAGVIRTTAPSSSLTMGGLIGETVSGSSLYIVTQGAAGKVRLTNSNVYNGPTLINGGFLEVPTLANTGVASPIGTGSADPINVVLGVGGVRGTLMLTGTNSNYSTNRGVRIGSFYSATGGGAIGVENAATNLTMSGQITGPGSLVKTGAGTLTLSGFANDYAGGTFVVGGTLALGNSVAFPPGRNVTVFAGATFDMAGVSYSPTTALSTLHLNGGKLRSGAGSVLYLNHLVTDAQGGDVEGSNSGTAGLAFADAGSDITINGNSTWTGATTQVTNQSGSPLTLTIVPGVTLSLEPALKSGTPAEANAFLVTGGGTLHQTINGSSNGFIRVNVARIRFDSLTNVVAGLIDVSLENGTFTYGGATASPGASPLRLGIGGGTLEIINAGTTVTLSSYVPGSDLYPLTKTGAGTLLLSGSGSIGYQGGLIINAGTLTVDADAALRLANPTVNAAGTLRYANSATTARTFHLNHGSLEAPSGLTLNGATINGGFLRGAGTFTLTGGTALNGVTAANGTTLNQTGPASATNFTNSGQFTNAAGQTFGWNGGYNTASGRVNVSGTMNVTAFESIGQINVNPGGTINNTGTDLYLGGGSRTFVATPGNTVAATINLGGQNLILAGGLLQNNGGNFASGGGIRNGTVIVDYGGRAKGTGYYEDVITQNGGVFSPGNSPGTTPVGTARIQPGGTLNIDIDAAGPNGTPPAGTAGVSPGWSLVQATGALRIYATPAAKQSISLTSQAPGGLNVSAPVFNFDSSRSHIWEIIQMQAGAQLFDVATGGTAINPSTFVYDPSIVDVLTAGTFLNSLNGGTFSTTFGPNAIGTFSVFISFTPVPEPMGILGVCAIVAGIWQLRRRRKASCSN